LRRKNDQKNQKKEKIYFNIDFEDGNCVMKKWFNTE